MIITFKRPKVVVQVFQNIRTYSKFDSAATKTEIRRNHWPHQIISNTGFAIDNHFNLPESIHQEPDFTSGQLILLNDYCPDSYVQANARNVYCLQVQTPQSFEIFKLDVTGETCEIYLDYTHHASRIGMPHRNNFKVGELTAGNSLRMCINGKHDFSLTGNRGRTYTEFDYIFTHLGAFHQFDIGNAATFNMKKEIPFKQLKTIDLRKILH
jgi:hypothetical protein